MKIDTNRLLPILSQLRELLPRIKNDEAMFGFVINMILVWTYALGAFFIPRIDDEKSIQFVFDLMNNTDQKPPIQVVNKEFVFVNPKADKDADKGNTRRLEKWLGEFPHHYHSEDKVELQYMVGDNIIQKQTVCMDLKHWAQIHKDIRQFMTNKAARYNKVLRLFNMNMSYSLVYKLSDATKVAKRDSDSFVNEFYDEYCNDILNWWTSESVFANSKDAESWSDVKRTGLDELFKFLHWLVVPHYPFESYVNSLKKSKEYHKIDQFEKQVGSLEKALLANSVLLQTPYKQWPRLTGLLALIQRQPIPIRNAILTRFQYED